MSEGENVKNSWESLFMFIDDWATFSTEFFGNWKASLLLKYECLNRLGQVEFPLEEFSKTLLEAKTFRFFY